jgi:hypothetical protein
VIDLLNEKRTNQGIVKDQRKREGFGGTQQIGWKKPEKKQAEDTGLHFSSPLPQAHQSQTGYGQIVLNFIKKFIISIDNR